MSSLSMHTLSLLSIRIHHYQFRFPMNSHLQKSQREDQLIIIISFVTYFDIFKHTTATVFKTVPHSLTIYHQEPEGYL